MDDGFYALADFGAIMGLLMFGMVGFFALGGALTRERGAVPLYAFCLVAQVACLAWILVTP
jgi:hypothetical protein